MTATNASQNPPGRNLKAVTSDCKPWPAPLDLCFLDGIVSQKRTKEWYDHIDEIYRRYEIYAQAGGTEQAVFVSPDGAGEPRSRRILACLSKFVSRPHEGRALDVGCGNGSFLREFNRFYPEWNLEGSEYAELNRDCVLGIPGVDAFHTSKLSDLPEGRYSLLSMIHLLEHIPDPEPFLREARSLLDDEGLLFVQVPGFLENPFELLIYDHASHFTPDSLSRLLARAGFSVISVSTEWVQKEISIVAKRSDDGLKPVVKESQEEVAQLQNAFDWLENYRDRMRKFVSDLGKPLVFGSSIAATWAYAELEGNVVGFLDEDTSRIGRSHLGKPIMAPDSICSNAPVVVPIAPAIAAKVREKFSHRSSEWMF